MTGPLEEIANQLARFVRVLCPTVGDRDDAALHRCGGLLFVFPGDGHGSDGREDRGASKGSPSNSTLNKVNLGIAYKRCLWPLHREAEKRSDAIPDSGIIERGHERGQGVERSRADDARRAFRPDSRKGRDRRERRAVYIERIFDRGEGTLPVAHDADVDEPIDAGPVRQADEDRIGTDLSAIRHMSILQLQEHVAEDGPLGNDAPQHLMVNFGSDRFLEPTELAVQPGRLELPSDRAHLPDVDPTNPEVFVEEVFQECEVQLERLLRLAVEAHDEIQAGQESRHATRAPLPPYLVHHANRFEAAVRVDVEIVRLRDSWIRRLESERQRVAGGSKTGQIVHRGHRVIRMRDHHRGIAVVRVKHLEIWGGHADPLEQLSDHGHINPRRRGGTESDRLVAEEICLASEAEVQRAEIREPTDLREDAGHVAKLRLAVHRLDAEGASLVDVADTALRRVELDGERLREIGMVADDVRTEERPTVPLFHRLVTVRPFAGRQLIVHGRIEVAQGDPVERLDQGFVVIPESRERATEDPGLFEGVRVMDDLLLANGQTSQIFPRDDGA